MEMREQRLDDEQLDRIFAALSDRTRRRILLRLRSGPATVTELTALAGLSQPAVSKHCKVLEEAGLVRAERDAQRIPRIIELAPLIRAAVFVSQFEVQVDARRDRLESHLQSGSDKE
ncbi:metalloregulator ArsR/SmtB family transcription factor [Agrococcus sp. Marseille-Q4369]|uniref:ArsR/SmtB family transcription factor n=1 Tax=Agrococcus sp. Marseille-Q4369 TaxID=2810513 RepID=UPI001B8B5987|nr:metalloregulator ArsR/SmtB family transcription factor [Agrococcus sp. Marseille-Q4369]QUW20102.1 helix-turn-helix transcriptional regulator [Agrococcus sp. Marseille-Q4369]